MNQTDLSTILTWGTGFCLLFIGLGAHRAWKAGHNKLAMLPLALLVAGLFVIPFALGFAGVVEAAIWIGRAFIPLAALVGFYLFFRFDGRTSQRGTGSVPRSSIEGAPSLDVVEIRSRLKGVRVVSVMYLLAILVFLAAIVVGGRPWMTIGIIAMVATFAMQVVFGVSLGYLAASSGMGGVPVAIATIVGTPLMAPYNYLRVVKSASEAMSRANQASKV